MKIRDNFNRKPIHDFYNGYTTKIEIKPTYDQIMKKWESITPHHSLEEYFGCPIRRSADYKNELEKLQDIIILLEKNDYCQIYDILANCAHTIPKYFGYSNDAYKSAELTYITSLIERYKIQVLRNSKDEIELLKYEIQQSINNFVNQDEILQLKRKNN